MKIRWVASSIEGTFHNNPLGVHKDEVVDLDEVWAMRYIASGYAVPITKTAEKTVERQKRAVEQSMPDDVETTTIGAEMDSPPHQVNKAALEPDAIVHDVTPDKGKVTEDSPLQAEPSRMPKTTVPTRRTPRRK